MFRISLAIIKFYTKNKPENSAKDEHCIRTVSFNLYLYIKCHTHSKAKRVSEAEFKVVLSFHQYPLNNKKASTSCLAPVEVQVTRSVSKETRVSLRVSDSRVV